MILIHVLLLLLRVLLIVVNLLFVHELVLLMLQLVDVFSQLFLSLVRDNCMNQLVMMVLLRLLVQFLIQFGQLSINARDRVVLFSDLMLQFIVVAIILNI